MNFEKKLIVNGEFVRVISDNIVLKKDEITKAIFVVENANFIVGDIAVYGIVSKKKKQKIFTGKIKTIVKIDGKQSRIFVDEIASDLIAENFIFSLNNCSGREILDMLEKLSKIKIKSEEFLTQKYIGNFVAHGTGKEILKQFSEAFDIPNFCWLSNIDSSIWIGNYYNSKIVEKRVDLPQDILSAVTICGADCMLIAGAFPGINVMIGNSYRCLTEININGNKMRLKW